jgi:hypothetical protein
MNTEHGTRNNEVTEAASLRPVMTIAALKAFWRDSLELAGMWLRSPEWNEAEEAFDAKAQRREEEIF